MSLTSFITRNTYPNEFKVPKDATDETARGKVIFSFDSIQSEEHTSPAQITDREIESDKGSFVDSVNDHLTKQPDMVVLVGLVSETPLDILASISGAAMGLVSGVNNNFGSQLAAGVIGGEVLNQIQSNGLENENNVKGLRTTNAYNILKDMQKNRIVFDLVTGLKNYKTMMIESIGVTKSPDLGKDAQYTATIKQVNIVNTEEKEADPSLFKADIAGKAAKEVNQGKTQATEASPKTTEDGSLALQGAESQGFQSRYQR